jgi:hypothetical protein
VRTTQKDLWPYAEGSVGAGVLRGLVLLLALPLLLLLALTNVVTGVAILMRRRGRLTVSARRYTEAIVALAVILVAVTLSPFGLALRTWALD